uniref:Uncharacterized protein n=1 Tax=Cacopsylla melanoneura TaxID=428564 RepID=A0A8D8USK5_9HEMI
MTFAIHSLNPTQLKMLPTQCQCKTSQDPTQLKYALPHPPARLSHDFHNAFAQSNTTQNASNSMPMQNITGSNPAQVCSATSFSQTKPRDSNDIRKYSNPRTINSIGRLE